MKSTAPIFFERTDTLPDKDKNIYLSVHEVHIPILVFYGIMLQYEKKEKLSLMEKFILEAALEIPSIQSIDIETVTSIPSHSIQRILLFFSRIGILQTEDNKMFAPSYNRIQNILKTGEYGMPYSKRSAFIYLPLSDDLIYAYDQQSPTRFADLFRFGTSQCSFPMPSALAEVPIHKFIDDRIKQRHIVNLPDQAVGVNLSEYKEDFKRIKQMAPIHKCKARILKRPDDLFEGIIYVYDSHEKRTEPFTLKLSGSEQVITDWMGIANNICENCNHEMLKSVFGLSSTDAARHIHRDGTLLSLEVDLKSARLLSMDSLLMEKIGLLAYYKEDLITFHFAVNLNPDGLDAMLLFAVDEIVRKLLLTPLEHITIKILDPLILETIEKKGLTELVIEDMKKTVIERLWNLHHYIVIYKLREHRDFCYE